ncbi:LPS export ABC transporter periplasmic protein LptC [Thalassolituus marinus]|uniref:LPS export ABC transporter periplasmic protein LptC n=1 Tax=Thalassolituus marinus TaxID=671053 RepID=A0ABS7ZP09_9GAMM|nr:LPS export ABC transporter periplasmic protein LptC [Thalassolituus marinus]MCA6063426.1 LPS export ABC transporter periplasmic protein LptC [Thalassolituus marinus]
MRKRYLLLIVTLVFGLALMAVDRYTQELVPFQTDSSVREADYYGEGLFSRQYGASGSLDQTFMAARSIHYPQEQRTEFSGPILTSTDDDGKQWQVTALQGEIQDNDHLLYLIGDVEIRPVSDNAMIIQTPALVYNSDTRIAETSDPVTITSPQIRVNATGMTMDLDRQRIEFRSEVTTHYVP